MWVNTADPNKIISAFSVKKPLNNSAFLTFCSFLKIYSFLPSFTTPQCHIFNIITRTRKTRGKKVKSS